MHLVLDYLLHVNLEKPKKKDDNITDNKPQGSLHMLWLPDLGMWE
jgi:hypothetical protein